MNHFIYTVERIDGDYAYLKRSEHPAENTDEDLKLVARALLPPEITEGCKLNYEYLQYTIL